MIAECAFYCEIYLRYEWFKNDVWKAIILIFLCLKPLYRLRNSDISSSLKSVNMDRQSLQFNNVNQAEKLK